MPKSWNVLKWRPRLWRCMASCLLAGLSLSMNVGAAEIVAPALPAAHIVPGVRMVLSTGSTVTNERIRYPSGAQAQITAVEITLEHGQQTGWHTHPVPMFAYILEGELTVDYGAKGERTYRKGDGIVEAINETHNGRNTGQNPVKILAVFVGMEGMQGSAPASPPARW